MVVDPWLDRAIVLPRVVVDDAGALADHVAAAVGDAIGVDSKRIVGGLRAAMAAEGCSLGAGIAIPHAELAELTESFVCVAITAAPVELPAPDGRASDVFFFVLSQPDPQAHLHVLAQLELLSKSSALVQGLRTAASGDDGLALLRKAARWQTPHVPVPEADPGRAVAIVSLSGESAVDALLVQLLAQDFGDACVLEAQAVQAAAAREVPLFAGFRDLFGDPGGLRVLLIDVARERVEKLIDVVGHVCREQRASNVRVMVLPVYMRWMPQLPASRTAPGH